MKKFQLTIYDFTGEIDPVIEKSLFDYKVNNNRRKRHEKI